MTRELLSIRLPVDLHERLEDRGRRAGGKSALGKRYIEEGLRCDDHPGIVFRPGPAGRRPALAGGPDVWEVIQTLRGVEATGEEAVTQTAEWMGLARSQVQTAVGYYADYREEIDGWLADNDRKAAEAEAAWLRQQDALA